ncbi:MAG: hypothetical protein D6736_12210 [Nitrospinota bacterium]|nr:MAG: hypothetical protein D6736_12210 [Nitrospinota bacterium]
MERRRKEGMRYASIVGVLLMFATGCGLPYRSSDYTDFTLFTRYTLAIQNGVTTEQQIRQWLGKPWAITRGVQGTRQYIYLFRQGQTRLDLWFVHGVVIDHDFVHQGGERVRDE